jgi:primosomal protein N' (replication factor Y)
MIAHVTLEIALRKEFDYFIPPELADQVDVGSRVQVPFGSRKVLGCVTGLAEESARAALKPILKVIGAQTLVTPKILKLARWIGEYYCCAPETALKSVLPEAVRHEQANWRERLHVRALPLNGGMPKLPARQKEVWRILEERPELPLSELLALAKTTAATVRRLEDRGLVTLAPEISERDPYAREHILPSQPLPLNPAQAKALAAIIAAMDEGAKSVAQSPKPKVQGAPEAAVQGSAFEVQGSMFDVRCSILDVQSAVPASAPPSGIQGPKFEVQGSEFPPSPRSSTFLLHGVTGSGKTEVYLQAIARALEQGKGAIVLVPEISLTPQTVERFKARFSSGPLQTLVAVLHSHLSAGERHDEWHKIRQGRARIAIGARSAIFAPVEPLGLIVVDEEHEHSYKQEEAPRYHARDVAIVRGQMEGAVVVLGSATPSLESYYNCGKGKYTLLQLPERADDKKMPVVRIVDMRQTVRPGKAVPIFSPQLKEAIARRVEQKEQVILFLNRRGYSTSLQCPLCGYVAECPNCSVSLTYHRHENKLCCHICAHVEPVPAVCPNEKCRNPAIRYSGVGTQRVEATLAKLFPHARTVRMDSDVLKRKEDYRRILGDFRVGKIDILVGTQMIAKGLHFPNVTLVGIIYADLALHQPDFRAGERTFQLLTQVAGRAGRGDIEGEVVVQAFTPFHPAIQFARRHDFESFYAQEMEFREQLKYPPVGRIALLTLKGRNEEKVRFSADYLKQELQKAMVGIKDLVQAGPAPAPLLRAETYYRYQIMLRAQRMAALSQRLAVLIRSLTLPDDVTLAVDIDPVALM